MITQLSMKQRLFIAGVGFLLVAIILAPFIDPAAPGLVRFAPASLVVAAAFLWLAAAESKG